MYDSVEKYGLDLHCTMILEEYRRQIPALEKMKEIVTGALNTSIRESGLYVNAVEARIKQESSLAGKLEVKGHKYSCFNDLTDIFGARVITFYTDDVDKISALIDKIFKVDWVNSVDKRKQHELDSFGYNSLHYICSIPESLYHDPQMPQINTIRFEIQMRTALQHVWATMYHDTGYKSGVEVPREYLRNLNRLAGMLELADEQFSNIRTRINAYRRQVQQLVSNGNFSEVVLDGDSFHSYLKLKPFEKLTGSIAAINQAEIHETTPIPYLKIFKSLGFETLGDVEKLIRDYSEAAYELAKFELGNTDIDIVSSTVGLQDLVIVYIIKNGGGVVGLTKMFDLLNGPSEYSEKRAERIMKTVRDLKFMSE